VGVRALLSQPLTLKYMHSISQVTEDEPFSSGTRLTDEADSYARLITKEFKHFLCIKKMQTALNKLDIIIIALFSDLSPSNCNKLELQTYVIEH